jgi:hypothetical protein
MTPEEIQRLKDEQEIQAMRDSGRLIDSQSQLPQEPPKLDLGQKAANIFGSVYNPLVDIMHGRAPNQPPIQQQIDPRFNRLKQRLLK